MFVGHYAVALAAKRAAPRTSLGTPTPRSPVRVGLELWANPIVTVALEIALLVAGLTLYQTVTRPRARAGLIGLWMLVGVLLLSYAMVVVEPPDPAMNHRAVAIVGIVGGAITIALASWADRHRTPLESAPGRA